MMEHFLDDEMSMKKLTEGVIRYAESHRTILNIAAQLSVGKRLNRQL